MTADAGGQAAASRRRNAHRAPGDGAARGPGCGAPGPRAPGDPRRDVRPSERGDLARAVPAVPRARAREPHLGRRRARVRGLRVQLRPDRPRPRPSRRRGGGRASACPRGLSERPVTADGRAGGAPGRPGAARRLGDVREERHRCHDAGAVDRARGDGTPEDPGGARARITGRRPGARRDRPGRRRRIARTSSRSSTTTWPASRPPPIRPGATWRASWSPRSGTTRGSTRRSAIRRSRGGSGPSATDAARCSPSTTCARASVSTSAGAGSRSASGRTSPRTARRSRTAIRSRRCSAGIPCGTPRRQVFVTGSFWFAAVPMAAALATIEALETERGLERMARAGTRLAGGPGPPGESPRPPDHPERPGPAAVPDLHRRRGGGDLRPRERLHGRGRPARGVAPPLAQLVPVGGAHGRRRGLHARPDGRGLRRRPCALRAGRRRGVKVYDGLTEYVASTEEAERIRRTLYRTDATARATAPAGLSRASRGGRPRALPRRGVSRDGGPPHARRGGRVRGGARRPRAPPPGRGGSRRTSRTTSRTRRGRRGSTPRSG